MLGEIATGKVTDENENAFYIQVKGLTYELKKVEITQDEPIEMGSEVRGFLYEAKDHKNQMTQFYPFAQKDQYGWGTVTDVRRDLGVFIDVGLNDKDVVLSLDDLSFDNKLWPKKDDKLLVCLENDHKGRIWAKLADENIFDQLASNFPSNIKNQNFSGTVYKTYDIGAFLITDEYYLAFVHNNETDRPLRLGERVNGRVVGISQYGRINMSVLPRSYEEIDDDAQMILMSLQRESDKTLDFYDKSDAQDIKNHFGISKSAFKRAIGHLLKKKLITEDMNTGTITLTELNEEIDSDENAR